MGGNSPPVKQPQIIQVSGGSFSMFRKAILVLNTGLVQMNVDGSVKFLSRLYYCFYEISRAGINSMRSKSPRNPAVSGTVLLPVKIYSFI